MINGTNGLIRAGTVALVTGASSGFGAYFARQLAEVGAKVALAARRADRLEKLAAELPGSAAIQMDVESEASIVAAFDAAEEKLGGVSILINNAGMNAEGLAVDLPAEEFGRILRVNLTGPFLCAREAARRMIARKETEGRIVNVASIGALKPLPGLAGYCASKAGLVMLTKTLAREWANRGINVNALAPGYVATELNDEFLEREAGQKLIASFPRRRLMQADDLGAMMLYLSSPLSAAVTGSVFTLDDGQTL
ncbi:MAG: SDR family NAD(P)-dependent oxidoreductase [Hyphomonadaceae bacterium]